MSLREGFIYIKKSIQNFTSNFIIIIWLIEIRNKKKTCSLTSLISAYVSYSIYKSNKF